MSIRIELDAIAAAMAAIKSVLSNFRLEQIEENVKAALKSADSFESMVKATQEQADELDKKRDEYAALERAAAVLQSSNLTARTELAKIKDELLTANAERAQCKQDIAALHREIDVYSATKAQLDAEIREIRERRAAILEKFK